MYRTIRFVTLLVAQLALAGNWPQFRGPNGSGVGKSDIPVHFRPESNVVWKTERTNARRSFSTPLVVGRAVLSAPGHDVTLTRNGGLFSCFDAETGEPKYQEERIGALGDYYASPVAAGGKICVISQNGTATILAAGDELKVLARNSLGETVLATPAISDNTLYVRTATKVYAFK